MSKRQMQGKGGGEETSRGVAHSRSARNLVAFAPKELPPPLPPEVEFYFISCSTKPGETWCVLFKFGPSEPGKPGATVLSADDTCHCQEPQAERDEQLS